jgi:hypothetical protein
MRSPRADRVLTTPPLMRTLWFEGRMFYEIRCEGLIVGQQYERLETPPRVGDVLSIGPAQFVVRELVPQSGRLPILRLAVLGRA